MSAAVVETPYPNRAYAWYVVGVLLVAYILSFVDREVIGLVVRPIKADLGLTDTQISWLLGPAFAIFYTLVGLPIAWLADRSNRRLIISVGVFLWSWMTAFCGLAAGYWQLFLARVGVGVGEAALSPPALSLLRDYFPRDRIGSAVGVYTLGISVGIGLANIISPALLGMMVDIGATTFPVVGTLAPWQMLFVIVGVPGILVSLLILTIREPLRRNPLPAAGTSVLGALDFVWARWRCYLVLFVAFSPLTIVAYGIGFWTPAFFERTYHLDTPALQAVLIQRGIIFMVCGAIGVIGAGWLCDVLARRYADGHLRVALGGFALLFIGFVGFPLMPTPELALLFFIPATLGASAPTAAAVAALVTIAPPHMRAQVTALYYFTINLIGGLLGTTSVAWFTDYYFHNEMDLRYSLAIVAFIAVVGGAALLIYCRKYFRVATEEARAWA